MLKCSFLTDFTSDASIVKKLYAVKKILSCRIWSENSRIEFATLAFDGSFRMLCTNGAILFACNGNLKTKWRINNNDPNGVLFLPHDNKPLLIAPQATKSHIPGRQRWSTHLLKFKYYNYSLLINGIIRGWYAQKLDETQYNVHEIQIKW